MGQGPRKGCVLAPPLFNMCFAAVLSVAEKRFPSDAAITDNMVQLQQKKGKAEKRGTSRTGQIDGRGGIEGGEEVQRWWSMLYVDDAGIVSRSPERLERMTTVIVNACSAFGLSVSDTRTESMCLQTKGGGEMTFTINAVGQVQTKDSVYVLGRGYQRTQIPEHPDHAASLRSLGCFQRYKMEIYHRPGVLFRL